MTDEKDKRVRECSGDITLNYFDAEIQGHHTGFSGPEKKAFSSLR